MASLKPSEGGSGDLGRPHAAPALRRRSHFPPCAGVRLDRDFGSAAGSDGLLRRWPPRGRATGRARQTSLWLARSPVDAPAAGAASSDLQPRRDAPPETESLGDRYPPIGARSRSRGRRPRPEAKGVIHGSGWSGGGGRKNPAAIACRSRIRLARRRGVAVFPGTRQRSFFSAPDASAFSTAVSRRATTFCGRPKPTARYCVYRDEFGPGLSALGRVSPGPPVAAPPP